jgi:CBS domain-containing protein
LADAAVISVGVSLSGHPCCVSGPTTFKVIDVEPGLVSGFHYHLDPKLRTGGRTFPGFGRPLGWPAERRGVMKTVRDILVKKGGGVWFVRPEDTIYHALKEMAEKNVGAVLVIERDQLRGIFSERDYARKVVLKGKSSRETPVSEAMTRKVAFVTPKQTIEECMALMTDLRIRHLPVIQDEKIIGVISIGDVVQAKISDQEFMIHQLESFITGTR